MSGRDQTDEVPPDQLLDDVLLYTLPSRYRLPDSLGDEAWARFGSIPPGYRRVQAICAHVHQHLRFRYGGSTAGQPLVDLRRPQLESMTVHANEIL